MRFVIVSGGPASLNAFILKAIKKEISPSLYRGCIASKHCENNVRQILNFYLGLYFYISRENGIIIFFLTCPFPFFLFFFFSFQIQSENRGN